MWVWNEADIANVIAALRDGTMNGTTYTDDMIDELVNSGDLLRKYAEFIEHHPKPAATMRDEVAAWGQEFFPQTDPALAGATLGYRHAGDILETESVHWEHIEDLSSTVMPARRSKQQKHDLLRKRPDRGGKVENMHAQAGDWGNTGTRPDRAHALAMTGLHNYTVDRLKTKWFHEGKSEALAVESYATYEM